jgi:preprotein translocase subunit SecG
MDFIILTAIAVSVCLFLIILAVLVPRRTYGSLLKSQLQGEGGHIFTPDTRTWQGFLARTSSPTPILSLLIYAGFLALLSSVDAGQGVAAISVAAGFYLLVRFMLQFLPPTFGITGKGITVLSWLPNYPLGPFGSGSVFIPWSAVEICAIDNLFLTVLTEKNEAKIVYPPEIEDKVCAFIDSLLRRRGYVVGTAK